MPIVSQIKNRRDEILEEMRCIRRLKRGHLSEQTLPYTAADGSVRMRGPYYSLQLWGKDQKNHSQRVPADLVPAVREAVEGFKKLQDLTEEFAQITETLTELQGPLLPEKKTSRSSARAKVG
jgi:hypothetical protein